MTGSKAKNQGRERLLGIIVKKLRKNGAKKIAIFGSYARHEERKDSDIDILVEFSRKISLMDLVGIEIELSEATGKKVDLLTKGFISRYMIDNVNKDMEVIYS